MRSTPQLQRRTRPISIRARRWSRLTPRHYAIENIRRLQLAAHFGSYRACAASCQSLGQRCPARPKHSSRPGRKTPRHQSDTSAFGVDLTYARATAGAPAESATELCEGLASSGVWAAHDVYRYPHVDELCPSWPREDPALSRHSFRARVAEVLKVMRRPATRKKPWSVSCTGVRFAPASARSTFIVGFPGETEEDFELLLAWLREARPNRVDGFKYENVEGAVSRGWKTSGRGDKARPLSAADERPASISADILSSRVGTELDVLIDEIGERGAIGRSAWDAPDIDGSVFLGSASGLKTGDLVRATVTRSDDYDLWAEPVRSRAG